MKNRIITLSKREIKIEYKKYLSLIIISFLGVLAFAGISATYDRMMASLDDFFDKKNYYDVKVVSTLGLTEDDISNIKKVKEVDDVFLTYSKDVILKDSKKESVVRVMGLNNLVNKVELVRGRLPKGDREIAVEESYLIKNKLKINDSLQIIDDDSFKNKELKIVGTLRSPLFISRSLATASRGNTNIGTGKIDYYAYVSEENFNLDYYTEAYITVKGAKKELTDSKKYNKLIENATKSLDKNKEMYENARYNTIYDAAYNEIKQNEEKGLEELNYYENKLSSSKLELDYGKKKLDDSYNILKDTAVLLDNGKNELDEGKKKLDSGKIELDNAKREIEEYKNQINEKLKPYNLTFESICEIKDEIDKRDISKEEVLSYVPEDIAYYDEITELISKIYDSSLDDILEYLNNNIDKLDEIKELLPTDMYYYDYICMLLDESKDGFKKVYDLNTAINYIRDAEELLDSKTKEYDYNNNLYNQKLNEYNISRLKYESGLNEYNSSKKIYESSLLLYNSKVSEYYNSKRMFEEKINDAKEKLKEIPKCKWYIYDRMDSYDYENFINDAISMKNLSKVFPIIFFIVAVLISLISMSRMVEDDRLEIGCLKSLGFGNFDISKKYIIYSLTSTLIGGVLGGITGFLVLPYIIWNIYKLVFDVSSYVIEKDYKYIIIGVTISIICICGTTLLTIKKVLKEKPSDLMRPKAPKNGKRVFLERIKVIWNNISFSKKVTIRNLFRYKKRVLMTIVGILGCTGLILTGYGIRDAIVDIAGIQYGKIFTFDQMVYITDNINENEIDTIFKEDRIKNYTKTKLSTALVDKYTVNLFVPEGYYSDAVKFYDLKNDERINLKDNEVIITDKLSSLTKKKKGDFITVNLSDDKKVKLKISDVCENHVAHYVFMNKYTYEKNVGEYKTNMVFTNIKDEKEEQNVAKDLLKREGIMSVLSVDKTISQVNNMLKSLNSVVVILIILSGALSFVVLYNLSNININERKREIATLKVLGFTDKEVDNYITKETIILTILGIGFGLIFGIILTNFITKTVEIQIIRFIYKIKPISFVYSILITILFTYVVNIITHVSLKKIDMVESLKSVE